LLVGRALRVLEPDAVLHAGSRGSNRGPIAWDSHDYASLIGEIGRAAKRHEWRVLAWCVMPNHFHLVVRMTKGGFSRGFQQINGNHSRRTNKRYGRDAHLWKNRPWAVTLKSPAQLVGAVVYTLRNPVDAGLCTYAHEWPYSSYRAMLGLDPAPRWLAVEEALGLFGSTAEEARAALAELVHRGRYPVSDTP
jgi:REP element-mobilizing transposase RayT